MLSTSKSVLMTGTATLFILRGMDTFSALSEFLPPFWKRHCELNITIWENLFGIAVAAWVYHDMLNKARGVVVTVSLIFQYKSKGTSILIDKRIRCNVNVVRTGCIFGSCPVPVVVGSFAVLFNCTTMIRVADFMAVLSCFFFFFFVFFFFLFCFFFPENTRL